MTAVDALFWAVCLVLVVAGASKLAAPDQVAATLTSLGLSRRSRSGAPGRGRAPGTVAAMAIGAVEVGLGLAALVVGGPLTAVGVALAYVAFAVIVVVARRRGLASCGCFGARSAPPSWVHVGVNMGSAAVASVAAVTGGGPLPAADGLAELGTGTAVVVSGLVLLVAMLVVVLDTTVADVVEATRALRNQNDGDQDDGHHDDRQPAAARA